MLTVILAARSAVAESSDPSSFLIILMDGVRPDHLGCYGYRGYTSPMVDELCQRGIVFTRAYAQSSWAPASIASVLASSYPSEHGVRSGMDALSARHVTLAETMQRHGYTTVGYTTNYNSAGRGFDRGFESLNLATGTAPDGNEVAADADRVTLFMLMWLDAHRSEIRAGNLFLYMRYVDPQLGRVPPVEFLRRFMPWPIDVGPLSDLNRRLAAFELRLSADEVRTLVPAYDAAIASVDAGIEELLKGLRQRNLSERLWVIVAAPFGESLGEHGFVGHGSTLYEEAIHVPLIVVPPAGYRSGFRYEGITELIDVAPTVLDLAGVPPEPRFKGRSLRPALEGGAMPQHEAVAELMPPDTLRFHTRAAVSSALRVRIDKPDQSYEVYDLTNDPTEQVDLALSWRERLAALPSCLRSAACRARAWEAIRHRITGPPRETAH